MIRTVWRQRVQRLQSAIDKYVTENLVSHWLGDRSLKGPEAWREAMANF